MDELDVNALFLGPKSENEQFFRDMLAFLTRDHIGWRQYFHPDDAPAITAEEQAAASFEATLQQTREVLVDLAARLQIQSMPWFSPRYLGHMNTDTLMAANLAYMVAILYNPNNCAYEGSPATTPLELEVGQQLARLMGYPPETAWGHITSGGTVANYEAVWIARNLKSLPLAVREAAPELVADLDDRQLRNLTPTAALDLLDRVKDAGRLEAVRDRTTRGRGVPPGGLGKILVPQSKHYSWSKAMDILGLGQDDLIRIPVTEEYRLDVAALEATIDRLVAEGTPILMVVGVVGSTEEGAVDELHRIVALRDRYAADGVGFYLHVDAAYGGYARAVFLDADDRFMAPEELRDALHEREIVDRATGWPAPEVYAAFRAIAETDSVTVDPHKMGYVPYAAGAILLRDRRVLDLISYFAAYVFAEGETSPALLGSYILEGSKAGATVASVWAAHQVVPLNITGYGRLIGRSVEGAHRFHQSLLELGTLQAGGRSYTVRPLTRPDFNIVVFAFNEQGNTDLGAMNQLNQRLYDLCSYRSGPVYANDFITSKTSLTREEYLDTPAAFAARCGLPAGEWEREPSVYVLRSCVLTPFLARAGSYQEYWQRFLATMQDKLARAGAG